MFVAVNRHYERGLWESVEDGAGVNDPPFHEDVEGERERSPETLTNPKGTRGTGGCVPSGC